MLTAPDSAVGERFEIRIGRDCYDFEKHEGAQMRVLDENELVHLLQRRLRKSEWEINELLNCYRQSAGKI